MAENENMAYAEEDQALDILRGVPVKMSVTLGSRKLSIKDLINYQKEHIIELETVAGDPLKLYVNGKLMGYGEMVMVNEKFGIRVLSLVDHQDFAGQIAAGIRE